MLAFGWVGFTSSDDIMYAAGAQGWLKEFPYLGDTHWALRHPFVLSVAASFGLFGVSEFTLALPALVYHLATLVLAYLFLARHFPPNAALLAALVVAVTPVFAITSTIPGADIAEVFFVLASLVIFDLALDRPQRWLPFLLAGVLAGLAWLTRETALGVVLLYGLLFLVGYGGSRRSYLWVGAGFALVAGAEVGWYWVQTGDPLYRLWVDLDQGTSRGAHLVVRKAHSEHFALRTKLPLLSIFGSHLFGLLFYLFIPAAIWAALGRFGDARQRSRLRLLATLALVWFATVGYIVPLERLERYFEVSALAAALLVGLWIIFGLAPRSRILAWLVASALVGSNLLAIYVDNREPLFGERALVTWVAEHRQPVYTDSRTASKAGFLLETRGLGGIVQTGEVPVGALYLYNPNSVFAGEGMGQGWVEEGRIAQDPKWIGSLIQYIGLDRLVPPGVMKKLGAANDPVVFFRRPPIGLDGSAKVGEGTG
jgi:hypothetical protein